MAIAPTVTDSGQQTAASLKHAQRDGCAAVISMSLVMT
jgi:hypothetical protein